MASDRRVPRPRFTRRLQRLKRDGCNLLVVGTLTDRVRRAVSRRLFGDEARRRYRLLVTTGGASAPGRFPDGLVPSDGERHSVVSHRVTGREAGMAAGVEGRRDIDAFRRSVLDAVAEFADREPSPGEFRLGFDGLGPVLAAYPEDRVLGMLDEVTTAVSSVGGIGHYYLPAGRGSSTELALREPFDAVLEQRVTPDGAVEERWHLSPDARTAWIEL